MLLTYETTPAGGDTVPPIHRRAVAYSSTTVGIPCDATLGVVVDHVYMSDGNTEYSALLQ